MEEFLEIIDREGRTISIAPKNIIHGNPSMLHKGVHILIFNSKGKILLQKRISHQNASHDKWDICVKGHVIPGENTLTTAKRKMLEELGVVLDNLQFLYTYIYSNEYESELIYTYWTIYEGPFIFNKDVIEKICFWKIEDIQKLLNSEFFTENFKQEFYRFLCTCVNMSIWFNNFVY